MVMFRILSMSSQILVLDVGACVRVRERENVYARVPVCESEEGSRDGHRR